MNLHNLHFQQNLEPNQGLFDLALGRLSNSQKHYLESNNYKYRSTSNRRNPLICTQLSVREIVERRAGYQRWTLVTGRPEWWMMADENRGRTYGFGLGGRRLARIPANLRGEILFTDCWYELGEETQGMIINNFSQVIHVRPNVECGLVVLGGEMTFVKEIDEFEDMNIRVMYPGGTLLVAQQEYSNNMFKEDVSGMVATHIGVQAPRHGPEVADDFTGRSFLIAGDIERCVKYMNIFGWSVRTGDSTPVIVPDMYVRRVLTSTKWHEYRDEGFNKDVNDLKAYAIRMGNYAYQDDFTDAVFLAVRIAYLKLSDSCAQNKSQTRESWRAFKWANSINIEGMNWFQSFLTWVVKSRNFWTMILLCMLTFWLTYPMVHSLMSLIFGNVVYAGEGDEEYTGVCFLATIVVALIMTVKIVRSVEYHDINEDLKINVHRSPTNNLRVRLGHPIYALVSRFSDWPEPHPTARIVHGGKDITLTGYHNDEDELRRQVGYNVAGPVFQNLIVCPTHTKSMRNTFLAFRCRNTRSRSDIADEVANVVNYEHIVLGLAEAARGKMNCPKSPEQFVNLSSWPAEKKKKCKEAYELHLRTGYVPHKYDQFLKREKNYTGYGYIEWWKPRSVICPKIGVEALCFGRWLDEFKKAMVLTALPLHLIAIGYTPVQVTDWINSFLWRVCFVLSCDFKTNEQTQGELWFRLKTLFLKTGGYFEWCKGEGIDGNKVWKLINGAVSRSKARDSVGSMECSIKRTMRSGCHFTTVGNTLVSFVSALYAFSTLGILKFVRILCLGDDLVMFVLEGCGYDRITLETRVEQLISESGMLPKLKSCPIDRIHEAEFCSQRFYPVGQDEIAMGCKIWKIAGFGCYLGQPTRKPAEWGKLHYEASKCRLKYNGHVPFVRKYLEICVKHYSKYRNVRLGKDTKKSLRAMQRSWTHGRGCEMSFVCNEFTWEHLTSVGLTRADEDEFSRMLEANVICEVPYVHWAPLTLLKQLDF